MQALQATPRICSEPRQTAGCAGGAQGQADASTRHSTADGFLTHTFLPLYEAEEQMPLQQEVEIGYYSSLSLMGTLHGIEPLEYKEQPYPYNILLSYWDAKRKLNRQPIDTSLHIVRDDNERVRLATKQVFSPEHTLYYIPVMPLFRLLRQREQKHCAELLLSVMAYFYHTVRIPYYREESSYLHYHYEINREWLAESAGDYEPGEYEENMSDILKNEYVGDEMERKIYNRYQLEHFSERLQSFRPQSDFQRNCLRVALDAWELMQAYPDATVFRNVKDVDPDDEIASFEPYVSFVGDVDGWLYDNVERGVSDELNEYAETAEPCKVQIFDDPEADKATGLDFEYRLFELICELTTVLTELP